MTLGDAIAMGRALILANGRTRTGHGLAGNRTRDTQRRTSAASRRGDGGVYGRPMIRRVTL